MFQRSRARPGARLGVSTGWILRSRLKSQGVETITGCEYSHIDARGLHYRLDGECHVAEVDTVVICAGQEPEQELGLALKRAGQTVDVIGGARAAGELDATRAISEGTRLAYAV
jgi:2,4-dienoyl-CoA reductase (NADPH2)